MPLELRSRTLQSTMSHDASQQTPPPMPPPCPRVPRIRDPPIFTGADGTDVEDWLAIYERVSVRNKWDEDGKFTNLVFYLAGVASLCTHLRKKYVSEHFDYTEINQVSLQTANHSDIECRIPTSKLLVNFLKSEDLLECISQPTAKPQELLCDFSDGDAFSRLDVCVERTSEAYKSHLEAFALDPTVNGPMYGITSASPLKTLEHFDITEQLPLNAMHGILEGGIECVVRHVLEGLVGDRVIRKQDLERVLLCWCPEPHGAGTTPDSGWRETCLLLSFRSGREEVMAKVESLQGVYTCNTICRSWG
ncbi:hypothetical protein HPB51_028426 [Rhipicephalus microplus]|uniref:Uncharacterized protein n=1 Tax=Rhipicephalus microplus TaxID=6941 RepID=A0A9J6CXN6_RHIMP|nr:hypothetical protein HPB51_028426 [Rhipicephalus microplus]